MIKSIVQHSCRNWLRDPLSFSPQIKLGVLSKPPLTCAPSDEICNFLDNKGVTAMFYNLKTKQVQKIKPQKGWIKS